MTSFDEIETAGSLLERLLTRELSVHDAGTPRIEVRPSRLPLSFGQERLFFQEAVASGERLYNLAYQLPLTGALDCACLKKSLELIIERHEILRTTFVADSEGVNQRIVPFADFVFELPIIAIPSSALTDFVQERALEPIGLEDGPLIKATLVRLSDADHVLVLVVHHLIFDGASMEILIRELSSIYRSLSQNSALEVPRLPLQYCDYAVQERERAGSGLLDDQLAYWARRLETVSKVLDIPTDRPRPALQSFHGNCRWYDFRGSVLGKIKTLARTEGATLFVVLLASFQALLARYTGQLDFLVGSPVANRKSTETQGLIGFFVNTVAFCADLSGNPTFAEVVRRVRATAFDAYANQDIPFEKVVEITRLARDPSRHPLFQVMLSHNQIPDEIVLPNLVFGRPTFEYPARSRFDLNLSVVETDSCLLVRIEYASDLFDQATIDRLARHWLQVLNQVADDPLSRFSDLQLADRVEIDQILRGSSGEKADYALNTIHEAFRGIASKYPDRIALVQGCDQITYKELDCRSNRMGHYLRSLGVGAEAVVGIAVDRSVDLIVALFGILKAGGAYLPLDPLQPRERLLQMAESAKATLVILGADDLLPDRGEIRTVGLDEIQEQITRQPETRFESGAALDNLAYVIFTSGSTGRPKGVMVPHRGVANGIEWMKVQYGDVVCPVGLQKTSIGFDVSVWEMFWPLCTGGKLAISAPNSYLNPALLQQELVEHKINLLHFVPSILANFISSSDLQFRDVLDYVVCIGEPLPSDLVRSLRNHSNTKVVNQYGPTETSVAVSYFECASATHTNVPIGRPIANCALYVLGPSLELVPVGIAGEVYIGGVCLARGYHGRPDLTAERFVPNPFVAGERLYRTGDVARWLADGNLEFLGRNDDQVKLRGVRVELGEIEAVLREVAGTPQAIVVVHDNDSGGKQLVAYLQGSESQFSQADLRERLHRMLPGYMIPEALIFLDEIPLTSSGKKDRNALAALPPTSSFLSPRNETEQKVADIWIDILGVERVGVYDNFFALGGHSLLFVDVRTKILAVFQVELALRTLFETSTLGELAEKINSARLGSVAPIRRIEPRRSDPDS